MKAKRILVVASALLLSMFTGVAATANGPGWSPVIIARGEYRQQIKSMPVEMRPYRPLHFYGNAVRWSYHRSTPSRSTPVYSSPVVVNRSRLFGR